MKLTSKPAEHARSAAARDYAARARPYLALASPSADSFANSIVAYLLLEGAVRCLGEDTVQAILDADPAIKNVVAGVQTDIKQRLTWLGSLPADAPRNIVHVDFRRPPALREG